MQASSALRRVTAHVLTAAALVVAAHVVVLCVSGGHLWSAYVRNVRALQLDLPLAVLLALIMARLLVGHPVRRAAFTPALFFLAILFIYVVSPRPFGSGDSMPARYLPLSIVREGNFDLDEFPVLYQPTLPYFMKHVNGHYVSDYPVGAPLLAVPVYLLTALGGADPQRAFLADLEKVAAAVIVAVSALLLYLALRRIAGAKAALVIGVIYALGSPSLSTSSQLLWQHGAGQLAVAAAIYCVVRAAEDARWAGIAGFPVAFAVISRPTNAVIVAPLAIFVVLCLRRRIAHFVLWSVPPIAFHLVYNWRYFGNPFRTQFAIIGGDLWNAPFAEGFAGVLLSPARGLLVYSPVFALSFAALVLAWRRGGNPLLRALAIGALLHVLLYSKVTLWWAGTCYGPRFFADLTPVLAFALYPMAPRPAWRTWARVGFATLAFFSIAAHAVGVFATDVDWSADVNVTRHQQFLWSWRDNQLINPASKAWTRFAVAVRDLPTSRTQPSLLAASYDTAAIPRLVTRDGDPLVFRLRVANDGRAVWLASGERVKGAVTLEWRWRDGERDVRVAKRSERKPLRYDVFPGRGYDFILTLAPPPSPGAYTLELGLIDEGIGPFAELGTPPVRVPIDVR